jgi:Domain of unknown function (DUF4185)
MVCVAGKKGIPMIRDATPLSGAVHLLAGLLVVILMGGPVPMALAASNPTVAPDVSYVVGSTRKISQLIGDLDFQWLTPTQTRTESRCGITGTDLGVSFTHKGITYVTFGDTQGGGIGGARDPLAVTTNTDLEYGLNLSFFTNGPVWRPITIPGISQGSYEVPLDGVSVNARLYLYHSTDHSASVVMGRSVVAVSTNDGMDFQLLYTLSRSNFINVSVTKVATADWPGLPQGSGEGLLLFGSGTYRASDVRLAFQPATAIEEPTALRYLAGVDTEGNPAWSTNETEAIALFDQPCVGELSAGYNRFIRRWILFYNCGNPRGINFRTAHQPWGPWSEPQLLFDPWKDGGYGQFMHVGWAVEDVDGVQNLGRDNVWGGEYGPYMFKDLVTGRDNLTTIYFTMSTWNPYVSLLMKTELEVTNTPVITVLPANQVAAPGESAQFTLTASAVGVMNFQWQRNGANISGATSNVFTLASVALPDTNALFRCIVSNASGSVTSNPVRVLIGAPISPPLPQILSPSIDTRYAAGDTINFAGQGVDAAQVPLPASAFSWKVLFVHDNYTVPFLGCLTGVTNGSFTIPTRGESATNVLFRILLTVTDSRGRQATVSREIFPRISTLTLLSQPAGMAVTLDGQPFTLPTILPSVVGLRRALAALAPGNLAGRTYDFRDWSDQGTVAHDIEAAELDQTLSVTYVSPTVLVSTNASWRYLATPVIPSNSWSNPMFDDSKWPSGLAPLGYGVPGLKTSIGFGGDPTNRYLTTYFRYTFTVVDPTVFGALLVRLIRADGGVVYLNGTEVFRSNMGGGVLSSVTQALALALPEAETTLFYETNIAPTLLEAGKNVIAVEIHKNTASSSSLSFNLELRASERDPRLMITRAGPAIQLFWPVPSAGYLLQSTTNPNSSTSWSPLNVPVKTNGAQNLVTLPTAAPIKYFRLDKP